MPRRTRSSSDAAASDREAEASPVHAANAAGAPMGRGRKSAVWTLIVLASVLALGAILATWINRQMLDDKTWSKASTQLIQDPAVQDAVSVYLVNSLYDNVDVPSALSERLPNNLKPLAAPVSAALRQPATDAVKRLLTRPRVQSLWIKSSTVTHEKLVNVLKNKTGAGISTGNGNVTLDLGALVKDVGPNLGLPASALEKLPPDTGVITVMRSDQLSAAQTGVRAIRLVSIWLVVLVFLMYAAALYIARGARRKTLRDIGWAFVFVGFVVLALRRFTGNYVIDTLAPAAYQEPARHVWQILSSILREVGIAFVLYGLVAVLGAVLAGPMRAATAVRRWMAPVLNEKPGIAWSVVGFAFILLILWGGTHSLRTWQGILILGGLLAVGVIALRRQTIVEFPGGGSEGATASAVVKDVAARASMARPRRNTLQRRRRPRTRANWPSSLRCTTAARSPTPNSPARKRSSSRSFNAGRQAEVSAGRPR